MENILWNTWQYLVDVFDCFLILYLFPENDADTSPAAQVLLSVPSRAGGGAVRL